MADEPTRRGSDRGRSVRAAIRRELAVDEPVVEEPQPQEDASEARTIVELDHVWLAFDTPVLEDVSFRALDGETVAIVGESGTGKSTILKLILRLLVPDRGQVRIDGDDITSLTFDEALLVRQKMGMVFQGAALFDSMSVFENVAYRSEEHTS